MEMKASFMIDIKFSHIYLHYFFVIAWLLFFSSDSRYIISGACAFSRPLNISQNNKIKGRNSSKKRNKIEQNGESRTERQKSEQISFPHVRTMNKNVQPKNKASSPAVPHTFQCKCHYRLSVSRAWEREKWNVRKETSHCDAEKWIFLLRTNAWNGAHRH